MAGKIRLSKGIIRELLIFAGIYAAWVVYMNMRHPHLNFGSDDAVVPCLFFLPPIGLFILYLIIIKYGVFFIIGAWFKRRRQERHRQ
jgi:hypothetical protein